MKLPIAIPTFLLPIALVGCAAQGHGSEAAAAPAKSAQEGPGEKGDDADAAEKIQKAEREVEYAQLELDLAKLSAAQEAREADQTVLEATQKLDAVKKDRDNYKGAESPTKLVEKQLDIDRNTQTMSEQKQELDELEAMYKQEDFAKLTKELVLDRGRKRYDFARRGLELAKKSQEQLAGFEIPKKQLELDQAVDRAEKALAEANSKKEKSALETKLRMKRAEYKVDEAQHALEKAKKKEASKPKDAKA